jgi:hypothetical protein
MLMDVACSDAAVMVEGIDDGKDSTRKFMLVFFYR